MSRVKWAEGHTASRSAAALASAIQLARPGIPLPIRTEPNLSLIEIPTAAGRDHHFVADISDDLADLGVYARLASDPTAYFWSSAFERWDYDSFEEMFEEFSRLVVAVSSRSTKITENSGLLFRSYELQYESAGGWVRAPGSGGLKFSNFRLLE